MPDPSGSYPSGSYPSGSYASGRPEATPERPDAARRIREQMRTPLPKRFYGTVSTGHDENGHTVLLDERPVRTPARSALAVPAKALAERIAAEWDAQEDVIDPERMPLTRLANTALDGVARDPQAVAEDILRFAGTDLLCYRAGDPEGLVERQGTHWDPPVDWARSALGARFVLAEGVMPIDQPRETIAAFSAHLHRFSHPLQLAALHTVTSLTGSAILALALAGDAMNADQVWTAAHVDEDWNIDHWGVDDEAAARRAKRREEMDAAATVLALMREDASQ